MITVRFPSGLSVQYNDAVYIYREATGYALYKRNNRDGWVADVPLDCIVEGVAPCRIYAVGEPNTQPITINTASVPDVLAHLRRSARARAARNRRARQ